MDSFPVQERSNVLHSYSTKNSNLRLPSLSSSAQKMSSRRSKSSGLVANPFSISKSYKEQSINRAVPLQRRDSKKDVEAKEGPRVKKQSIGSSQEFAQLSYTYISNTSRYNTFKLSASDNAKNRLKLLYFKEQSPAEQENQIIVSHAKPAIITGTKSQVFERNSRESPLLKNGQTSPLKVRKEDYQQPQQGTYRKPESPAPTPATTPNTDLYSTLNRHKRHSSVPKGVRVTSRANTPRQTERFQHKEQPKQQGKLSNYDLLTLESRNGSLSVANTPSAGGIGSLPKNSERASPATKLNQSIDLKSRERTPSKQQNQRYQKHGETPPKRIQRTPEVATHSEILPLKQIISNFY